MRITAITPQERNPSRRNIFVDGAFAIGISAETLLRFALRTNDEISPELLHELERTEEFVSARTVALRYIGVRPRTEKEIRDKLREKEFGDEEIQKTVESLRGAKLLDDAEFARMYIRDQMNRRPAGALYLRRKLLLLGVDKETVTLALADRPGGGDDVVRAAKVARDFVRKSRALRKNEPEVKIRKRTTALLARRGFSWDVIQAVCKSIFSATSEGPDDYVNE